MEGRFASLWRGARPLIGTVVGVGIFGLPYALAQAGYVLGFIELVLVFALNLVVLLIYADLVLLKGGHSRFVGVLGDEVGPFGKILGVTAFFGSLLGAMVAYILIGGQFAHTVLSPLFGGVEITYQILFWLIGIAVMFGGLFFVVRLQSVMVPILFLLIATLVAYALPSIAWQNIFVVHTQALALPFGVILFAFSGLSAIPEMKQVLGHERSLLKSAIVFGNSAVLILYVLFTLAIVGVSGAETTPEALTGLQAFLGPCVLLGSILGMFTVFGAFVTVGVSLVNTLVYDYRYRYFASWAFVVLTPFCVFLLGARDFIHVIGFTGGVLSSLLGLLLIFAYERARLSFALPKRALSLPQWLVGLSFLMFISMFVLTIVQLVR